ncbi:MAG: GC-type dockerin domain-anchored protein [Phycisphaerales bacterium]
MQALGVLNGGFYSRALGVSRNGAVVTGYAGTSSGARAFRWTTSSSMQSLGTLSGDIESYGYGVSGNGTVIVGDSVSAASSPRGIAFRWTSASGIQSLGAATSPGWSSAQGTNNDGTIVYGSVGNASVSQHAGLWTARLGMVDLNAYLSTAHIDLTGWELTAATGVSDDGSVIAGYGLYGGQTRGWVVKDVSLLSCNAADVGRAGGVTPGDGVLNNNDFIAFYALHANGDLRADVGHSGGLVGPDGAVDNNDLIAFITLYYQGCP